MATSGLQQDERADDIGLHEVGRSVDRAVNVAFRRQMHHSVRIMRLEHLAHRLGVADIGLHQKMPVMPETLLQRVFRRGVGHLVHVDDHMIGVA